MCALSLVAGSSSIHNRSCTIYDRSCTINDCSCTILDRNCTIHDRSSSMEGYARHSRSHFKSAPQPPPSAAAYHLKGFANGAGNGFMAYNDVFGGPPKFGATPFAPRAEDYLEIFEGFRSSRSSSIPMLDLPPVDNSVACARAEDYLSRSLSWSFYLPRVVSTSPAESDAENQFVVAKKLGFEVISEEFLMECKSRVVFYTHKKTGAEVTFVSNEDENKVIVLLMHALV